MACSFVLFNKSFLQRGVMLMTFADRPYTRKKLLQSPPQTATKQSQSNRTRGCSLPDHFPFEKLAITAMACAQVFLVCIESVRMAFKHFYIRLKYTMAPAFLEHSLQSIHKI